MDSPSLHQGLGLFPFTNGCSMEPNGGGWGVGLRFSLNQDRLNLRIDRGFGRGSRGLYISAGEAF
jgi:hypothetical protein